MKKELSKKAGFSKVPVIVFALCFLALALWAQKSQPPSNTPSPSASPEYKIPPEAAARVNPIKPTEESRAKATKFYDIDCAMCHGKDGNGKGDMASDIKNITDFTAPDAMKNRTDGELFYIIRNGKGDMPPEGDRAKNDDVWNLVNYIRAFAKK
ncbi:MAG: cytochrome c [Terriglobales bacterium]